MHAMRTRLLILVVAALALPAASAHAQPAVGPFHAIPLTSHGGDLTTPGAGASTISFILPAGLPGEELELAGAGAAPAVTLTSPTGATIIPPPSLDAVHVDVRLLRPAAGTWVISLAPASPAVVALAGATVSYPSAREAKRPRGTQPNRSSTPRFRRPSGGRRR
jgi:hypothetical protein